MNCHRTRADILAELQLAENSDEVDESDKGDISIGLRKPVNSNLTRKIHEIPKNFPGETHKIHEILLQLENPWNSLRKSMKLSYKIHKLS